MKRIVFVAFSALALLAAQAPAGRAEPSVLSEEQLDLVTAGYAGTYTGTLYNADATAELGTFSLKIASNGNVKGTVNVTGRGEYKLTGTQVGAGFGGTLEKGKKENGGFFAYLSTADSGYRVFGTWAVPTSSGEIDGGFNDAGR